MCAFGAGDDRSSGAGHGLDRDPTSPVRNSVSTDASGSAWWAWSAGCVARFGPTGLSVGKAVMIFSSPKPDVGCWKVFGVTGALRIRLSVLSGAARSVGTRIGSFRSTWRTRHPSFGAMPARWRTARSAVVVSQDGSGMRSAPGAAARCRSTQRAPAGAPACAGTSTRVGDLTSRCWRRLIPKTPCRSRASTGSTSIVAPRRRQEALEQAALGSGPIVPGRASMCS